jgi:hypothetical protein
MRIRMIRSTRAAAGLLAVLLAVAGVPAGAQDCTDLDQKMHIASSLPYGARFLAVDGDHAYLSSLQVVDVSAPDAPQAVGAFAAPNGTVRAMTVAGGMMYAVLDMGAGGDFNGLAVYDLTDPAAPALTGSLATPGIATQVRLMGSLALVRNDEGLVTVVDVADPAAPSARGSFGDDWLDAYDVMGEHVYAVNRVTGKVAVVSLANPDAPALAATLDLPGVVDIQSAYGHVHMFQGGAYGAYDVSSPLAPALAYTLPVIDREVIMQGDRAYAYGLPFAAYDMTDPAAPVLLREAPFVLLSGFMRGDWILGGVSDDFVVIDAASADVAAAPTATLDLTFEPGGVAAMGDHVLVLERMGVDVVDASACGSPALVANYQVFADNTGFAVLGDHLYLLVRGTSAATTGLHVVDLSDPANPAMAAEIQLDGRLAGLAASGSHLYAGDVGAIVVVDVSDPSAPFEATRVYGRNFGAPCVADGDVLVSAAFGDLRFFDISQGDAPATLVSIPLPFLAADLALADGLLAIMHDDGVDLWDAAMPIAPQYLSSVAVPGSVDAMAVAGGYLFVDGHGIHVIDLTDPAAPAMVGGLAYEADRFEGLVAVNGCLYYPRYVSPEGGRLNSVALPCGDTPPPSGDVVIDIRPGSDHNPVNCGESHGVLPVAILTTDTFDALTVDHTTVRFGPAGAAEAHASCGRGDDDDDDDGDDCDDRGGRGDGGADKGRGRDGRDGRDDRDRGRDDHGRGRDHEGCDNVKRHEEDVDGDGDVDLVFHFRLEDTGIVCGDTEAWLTGLTFDGVEISGSDKFVTVGGRGGPDKAPATISEALPPRLAPNPFNPKTAVSFRLAEPGHVRAEIYDIAGRRVTVLADRAMAAGDQSLTWLGRDDSGRDVPSGVYFVRVTGPGVQASLRAVLLR